MSTPKHPIHRIGPPGWFLKGEGTGNDFVVMADLDGHWDPPASYVAALCDRRRGIGADGLLRIARVPDGAATSARFFMDYRNADGSLAEMCGNGARVFALALRQTGLETSSQFDILTRGGTRRVVIEGEEQVRVGLGPARHAEESGLGSPLAESPGRAVWMPNPHAVFPVPAAADLAGLGLAQAPEVWPREVFPDGVNVEFVCRLGDHHIAMRVYERGVGETQSCGTGAAAAAVASAIAAQEGPGGQPWRVDVPGGRLEVTWQQDDVHLAGPARIVAAGQMSKEWENANGADAGHDPASP